MKSETTTALASGGGYLPAVEDDYTAPLAVHPAGAARMLGLGLSKTYELMQAGELPSYRIGRSRFIPVRHIHAYIGRRMAEAAGGSGAESNG